MAAVQSADSAVDATLYVPYTVLTPTMARGALKQRTYVVMYFRKNRIRE